MLRTHGTMPAFVSRSISSGLLAHSSAYLHATTHVHGCGGLVDVIVLVVGSYDLFKQCARARSMRTGSTRPGERVTKRAGRWARGWRRRRRRWRSRWRWCFSLALCDAKRAASEDSRPHEAIVGTIDHRLLVPHRRTYITQKTASLEPTAKRAISHRRIHQIEKKAAPDSVAATKRVPTQTAPAPMAMAAASPRPSKIPPAATTSIGCPVCFELRAPVHLRAPHPSQKECPRRSETRAAI